jgi:hypothetical protein
MPKIKMYRFKDFPAFTYNAQLVALLGEAPHIRQVSVVVGATSKKAALEALNAVGLGTGARETHLCLSDTPRNQKLMDDGVLRDGTVLVSATTARIGSNIVSVTPSDSPREPELKVVGTVER